MDRSPGRTTLTARLLPLPLVTLSTPRPSTARLSLPLPLRRRRVPHLALAAPLFEQAGGPGLLGSAEIYTLFSRVIPKIDHVLLLQIVPL